jgi:hypothetical protein
MNGILILTNFGWLNFFFWTFDICVKTIKSWYWL